MRRPALIAIICCLVIVCTNGNAQWERFSGAVSPWYLSCAAFDGANLFAGESAVNGGLLRSSDAGKTWTWINSNLPTFHYIRSLAVAGKNIFAGTDTDGVFLSTDSGTSWTHASNGLPPSCEVLALVQSGSNLVAGCTYHRGIPGGVFLSSDGGKSWVPGGALGEYVVCLYSHGPVLLAGTLQGVYRSLDDGRSWTTANSGIDGAAESFAAIGENLFAGTYRGVFLSTDKGVTWRPIAASQDLSPVATVGTTLFASFPPGQVAMSSDTGRTWTDISQGMQQGLEIVNLMTGAGFLFAACDIGGLWRRPLAQMVTSVQPGTSEGNLQGFRLEQNYPNPFNPTTGVRFSVPTVSGRDLVSTGGRDGQVSGVSDVKLVVYDLLGREVAVLVNEKKAPGSYEVQFDARGLASGNYFYRMHAGSFVQTRTMLLIR